MRKDKKSTGILGVIPARYNSTRFPGKPLADINGKTMIRHVYEKVKKSNVSDVIIATDDIRISEEVSSWGLNVIAVMTKDSHQSGTDRMFEAIEKYENFIGINYEGYINIQGDEPLINPIDINKIHNSINSYSDIKVIITMVEELSEDMFPTSRNIVKAIVNVDGMISGFFRAPIFCYNPNIQRHIGIYGMTREVMLEIKKLSSSPNEEMENLEQLRWLDNKILMFAEHSSYKSIGIDTPEDLEKVRNN